jgi:hypothetical protein
MNKLKYLILPFFFITSMVQAHTPIRQWFTEMPDSILPLLTKNNRLDFIDFADSHMEGTIDNRLDGKSRIKTLNDDYLYINYTPSCDVEMKLLPINDSTDVLCMVTTMKGGVKDSRITFFDKEWQPYAKDILLKEPDLQDFRTTETSDSAEIAWKKMDILFRTYTLSPDTTLLVCKLSTIDYLNKKDRNAVTPYLRAEAIEYIWKDGRYTIP